MREALQAYVKRVGELAEPLRGNEPAAKPSPVGPLFLILGDDRTDPPECIPEYRVDFGPDRSVKPAARQPIAANAINEWARHRTLTAVPDNPAWYGPLAGGEAAGGWRRPRRNLSPTSLRMGRGRPSGRKTELTSRQEARKRRIASNVKPFIATLRVTNPVRKSWASSRKRVLRGGG